MTQPNALYLADVLEDGGKPADIAEKAAAELRRLHAELERCKQVCAATSEAWREEAALAEPVQEPVAWYFEARHIDSAWAAAVTLKHPGPEGKYMRKVKPLYTTPPQRPAEPVQEPVAWSHINGTSDTKWQPPQRKPLTDDEIKKLLIEHAGMTVVFSEVDLRFARAIERAHGIGGNDE